MPQPDCDSSHSSLQVQLQRLRLELRLEPRVMRPLTLTQRIRRLRRELLYVRRQFERQREPVAPLADEAVGARHEAAPDPADRGLCGWTGAADAGGRRAEGIVPGLSPPSGEHEDSRRQVGAVADY